MAEQAQGSNCKLGYEFESAYRVVPAAPALRQLYIESESIGADYNLISSNIIGGGYNPRKPSRGNQNGSGGIKTTLSPQLAPLFLRGAVNNSITTTGAGPYVHTGKLGVLPSIYFEKQIPDVNLYMLFNGYKTQSVELVFPQEGPIQYSHELMGACESMILPYDGQTGNFTAGLIVTGGTSGAKGLIVSDLDAGATGTLIITGISGTFQDNETLTDGATGSATANIPNGLGYASVDATYTDPGHTPWDSFDITLVSLGGAALLNISTATVRINRNPQGESFAIGGRGTRTAVPVGRAEVSGDLTFLLDSRAQYDIATRFQESSLQIKAQLGTGTGSAGNEYFEALLPELYMGKVTPKIETPNGIVYTMPFQAFYDNASEATAAQFIIKNTMATL